VAHPPGLPEGKRWRCNACGNLTRFDVESTERVRRFWHFDLAGDAVAEEEEHLDVQTGTVMCRWCGSRDAVVTIDVPRPARS
jgi:hypothetical protein